MALTAEQQAMDFNPELQDVGRQRKLAELLMAQGMQQPQGQMISGQYVAPSFTQQLNPLANILAGQAVGQRADTEQTDLARKLRELSGQEVQDILETYKKDPNLALQKASTARTPQARALAAQLSKATILEPTTLEREYAAAKSDPNMPFKGSFNDFKNQLTESQKASILNDQEGRRIDRARLNLTAQEQSFNTGMPIGGISAPQGMPPAPLRTISPGSPILAPGQQIMPQAGQPQIAPQQTMPQQAPRFNSKAEQDIYVATQKEKGKLQAEAQAALPTALNTVNSGLKAIEGMIGDTTVNAQGNLVYGKTKPHPGFNDAVGFPSFASGFGASSFVKGSDWKNFEARFKQIEGKSFLAAIDSLRGTGAISEIEGGKATAAINRMSLSQSQAEFVEAANELKTIMANGYAAAQQKSGVKLFNPNTQPTLPGATKRLVYNPQTGTLE
jgi:hypothetical protein